MQTWFRIDTKMMRNFVQIRETVLQENRGNHIPEAAYGRGKGGMSPSLKTIGGTLSPCLEKLGVQKDRAGMPSSPSILIFKNRFKKISGEKFVDMGGGMKIFGQLPKL